MSAEETARGLEEMGFVNVTVRLAHDWAFFASDDDGPGAAAQAALAEAAAWGNGHPKEVGGALYLAPGSEPTPRVEAYGYDPTGLDGVEFVYFGSDETEQVLDLATVRVVARVAREIAQ